MNDHPSPEQLRDYVMGSLMGAEADALEAHVVSCPDCAAALQTEAKLEEQLHAIGGAKQRRPRRRWVALAAVVTAAAAAAFLWARTDPVPPTLQVRRFHDPPRPVCVRDPARCADAALHGLHSPGDPIPRYEDAAPARLSLAPEPSSKQTP